MVVVNVENGQELVRVETIINRQSESVDTSPDTYDETRPETCSIPVKDK
jgi:hypothetical protein